jgi:hypothetical protein
MKNFSKDLDKVSAVIKGAEESLRENCILVEVELDGLSWVRHGKEFRLVWKGRPLMECPAHERIKALPLLKDLVADAIAKMELVLKNAGI